MVKYIVGLVDKHDVNKLIVKLTVNSYSRAGALNKASMYLQPLENQFLRIVK